MFAQELLDSILIGLQSRGEGLATLVAEETAEVEVEVVFGLQFLLEDQQISHRWFDPFEKT